MTDDENNSRVIFFKVYERGKMLNKSIVSIIW